MNNEEPSSPQATFDVNEPGNINPRCAPCASKTNTRSGPAAKMLPAWSTTRPSGPPSPGRSVASNSTRPSPVGITERKGQPALAIRAAVGHVQDGLVRRDIDAVRNRDRVEN